MTKKRGLIPALLSSIKFAFTNAKEPSYEQSRLKLWNWANTVEDIYFWYQDRSPDIPGLRDRMTTSHIEDVVRNHNGSDIELFDKLSRYDFESEERKIECIQRVKSCIDLDGVIKTTKAAFEDPSIVELCNNHKKLIEEGAYHDHSMAFSHGLVRINSLYQDKNIEPPFAFTKELAETMAASSTFATFLENRRRDLHDNGRKGKKAKTILMDMIESGSTIEEKRAIKSIFQSGLNSACSETLYDEMKYVENRDNISLDPAIYDSLCQ